MAPESRQAAEGPNGSRWASPAEDDGEVERGRPRRLYVRDANGSLPKRLVQELDVASAKRWSLDVGWGRAHPAWVYIWTLQKVLDLKRGSMPALSFHADMLCASSPSDHLRLTTSMMKSRPLNPMSMYLRCRQSVSEPASRHVHHTHHVSRRESTSTRGQPLRRYMAV